MKRVERLNQNGAALGGLLLIVMVVLLMLTAGFGLWAYAGREDYKNNADKKIAAAVEVAKKEASDQKDLEFLEKEKQPFKTYTGPAAYGSLTFQFPKTWSGLVTESAKTGDKTPVDGYFTPGFLPGIGLATTAYALRVQINSVAYEQVLSAFNGPATSGKVKVTPYKPDKVTGALGVKIDGEIINGKQGSMVVLPLRDKTIQIWTESDQFVGDFNNSILPSLSFVP